MEARKLKRMAEICIANDVAFSVEMRYLRFNFPWKERGILLQQHSLKKLQKKVITCISATKTFNLAGLQASTTIFPNEQMKQKFDSFWMNMDIHETMPSAQ